jgi:hypothetical protein
MILILEPMNGAPEANLDRAKQEIERVLAFRGAVSDVMAKGKHIIVEFEVNPKWDLPTDEKVKYLEEWIPTKVRMVFEVVSVSTEENIRRSWPCSA